MPLGETEMLKSVDCDAVYIGTPVMCHYEQAMTALSFGKHTFVEKPICINAEQSRELVDAFKKAGKQLTIGYMMKYHNLHEKAKENNGLRLSSETRSWTHASIYDYVNEFREQLNGGVEWVI